MNRRELLGSAGALCLAPACATLAGEGPRDGAVFEALLHVGTAHSGAGHHRWADIRAGEVSGALLDGVVRGGRIDWHVDPATGAVEVALACQVLDGEGRLHLLTDGTVHAGHDGVGALPGIPSAPTLRLAGQAHPVHDVLVGRIDARGFERGLLRLRAFDRAQLPTRQG